MPEGYYVFSISKNSIVLDGYAGKETGRCNEPFKAEINSLFGVAQFVLTFATLDSDKDGTRHRPDKYDLPKFIDIGRVWMAIMGGVADVNTVDASERSVMLLHDKIVEADKATISSGDNVEIKLKLTRVRDSNREPVGISPLINLNPTINVDIGKAWTVMGENGIETYALTGDVANNGGEAGLVKPCLKNMFIGCELFLSPSGDGKTYIGTIESFKEIPKPFWSR